MQIVVINGSPKGQNSVTVHSAYYLEKVYAQHHFTYFDVGQKIRVFEKNMADVKQAIENAQLVIFVYPVYTFIAPYQLHRFIELMKENKISLEGKFATQISTSKHFYDVTAHKYIEENAFDLKAKVIPGLSQDMDELIKKDGPKHLEEFFDKALYDIEQDFYQQKAQYQKEPISPYKASCTMVNKTLEKEVIVLTTQKPGQDSLTSMIEEFIRISPHRVRVINLHELRLDSGCIGCLQCSVSGMCIFKDRFDEFLRNEIHKTDAIVYAFEIENHYADARFKCYDDRQFCNGHRALTKNMPIGYILSGHYASESNLQMIIEARAQVGHCYMCGVVSDEVNPKQALIQMNDTLNYALINKPHVSKNFFVVGGSKIFRDLVYVMGGIMKADHEFYKTDGTYDDLPHKQKMTRLKMSLIGWLMNSNMMKKNMKSKMNEYVVMPYQKVIQKAQAKK